MTGRYILTAQGYRSDGLFADSSIVIVDLVAPASQVTGSLREILPVLPHSPRLQVQLHRLFQIA
jgi:hypothetical protein